MIAQCSRGELERNSKSKGKRSKKSLKVGCGAIVRIGNLLKYNNGSEIFEYLSYKYR